VRAGDEVLVTQEPERGVVMGVTSDGSVMVAVGNGALRFPVSAIVDGTVDRLRAVAYYPVQTEPA
jgi:hypothetical protein